MKYNLKCKGFKSGGLFQRDSNDLVHSKAQCQNVKVPKMGMEYQLGNLSNR
jgi:hypothetical protein